MRRRSRRTGGLSFGTIAALTLLGLVAIGCVFLFPRLMGNVQLRIDPQRVGVAIDSSLRSLRNLSAAPAGTVSSGAVPNATPATAPPLEAAVSATPQQTASPVQNHTLSLTVGGALKVDNAIQKTCSGSDGYTFGPVFNSLTASWTGNINLATLENLSVPREKLTDINMPSDTLTTLTGSGVQALCLGFPGVLNNGMDGLAATLSAVSLAGMTPYGAYTSLESRNHITTLQVQDTTLAFLSFQNDLSAAGKKAATREEQAYAIAPLTLPAIEADIAAARAAGAQIVVVSLRWGKSGAISPTATQRDLAQSIADAGADILLGTGTGAVQNIELLTAHRKDGSTHTVLCAYSLGNLLASDRSDRENISGVLLHIGLNYNLAADSLQFDSLTYTPTYVWRGKTNGKTFYRIVPSNAPPPSDMSEDQQKVMERCLALIRDRLADSPVQEAR